jgi:hypothetical protein
VKRKNCIQQKNPQLQLLLSDSKDCPAWAQVEAVWVEVGEDGESLGTDAGAGQALDDQVAHQGGVVLPHDGFEGAPAKKAHRPLTITSQNIPRHWLEKKNLHS